MTEVALFRELINALTTGNPFFADKLLDTSMRRRLARRLGVLNGLMHTKSKTSIHFHM